MKKSEMIETFPSIVRIPGEKPKQYQAFLDYIDLGPDRSLRELALKTTKLKGRRIYNQKTLQTWSAKNRWQARLADYVDDLAKYRSELTRERLASFESQAWDDHDLLHKKVVEMIEEFDKLKITKRIKVSDPTDPTGVRQIETVYFRVNTGDLVRLVKAAGQLGKDLRAKIGANTGLASITLTPGGGGKAKGGFKAYIGFTPDEWPEPGIVPDEQVEKDAYDEKENAGEPDHIPAIEPAD